MVKLVKPIPGGSFPLGHAKENKAAEVYAKNGTSIADMKAAVSKPGNCLNEKNISVGGISKGNYAPENPYGTGTMRGYGAATKGRKISGKQG